jgi:hypothetical protein
MKKLLFICLMFSSLVTFAQDNPATTEQTAPKKIYKSNKNQGQNELKLNALLLILGAFEASYERILTEESSVGLSFGKSFDKEMLNYNYTIEPYYRYFFGRRPAAGFYIEGFGSINSRKYSTYEFNNSSSGGTYKNEDRTNFGLGIGVGGKFVTNNNLVFELGFGIGRNLTAPSSSNLSYNGPEEKVMGRAGISVGYRF